MATQVVSPKNLTKALSDILDKFDENNQRGAGLVMKETMKNLFGSIIEETPVGDFDPEHEGTLKGSWQLTRTAPATRNINRRRPHRTRSSLKFTRNPSSVLIYSWFLTSNSPYINTVEYGGYPKSVKRGTFNKRSGRFQIRSAGGFSKQAPKGMVRKNVRKLKRFLEVAANKVL